MAPVPALLSMRDVKKAFGAVRALDGVDLSLGVGQVHALIGENGAGKSTLMKILAGALPPDAGSFELEGRPYRPGGPLEARQQGVSMIYQELNLAAHLSVAENIVLGREGHRFGFLRRKEARAKVREALETLGHQEIDPQTRVADLSPGARQMVEVARALVFDARVVVMDEPTSSLSARDADRLFEVIGRLARRGIGVIYISHFLEEVFRVADSYTVLRDGRSVGTGLLADVDRSEIIRMMVGRDLDEVFPRVDRQPGGEVLRLEGLAGDPLPRRADLRLHEGEILGIAGLVGAGRTEMLRTLFGLEPIRSGRVVIAGVSGGGRSPTARLAQGLGLLSEDRKEEGLALDLPIALNLGLSRLAPFSRAGWISRGRQTAAAQRLIERLSIRCRDPWQAVGELSGGNQQKVALARLLHQDADVLLLDEPTRGVDVASKTELYRLMGELARAGKAILFVSSYIPELLGVCDRIAVMHRGVLHAPRPAVEWTERQILEEATRGAA